MGLFDSVKKIGRKIEKQVSRSWDEVEDDPLKTIATFGYSTLLKKDDEGGGSVTTPEYTDSNETASAALTSDENRRRALALSRQYGSASTMMTGRTLSGRKSLGA